MNHKILITPFHIGNLVIKNRFVQTPVEVGMAAFDGKPTELLTDYYLQRVKGDVGLLCTGICRVNNVHGVTSPRQLSLARNGNIKAFQKMNARIHEQGGKIAVQLHHPGRQNYSALVAVWPLVEVCSRIIPGFGKIFPFLVKILVFLENIIYEPAVVSASAIPCGHVNQKTRALRTNEVKKLVKDFVDAAVRARKSGFDAVELHGAHGYLIQQFLSPHTNQRKDEYGGSFENRFRFLKEIIQGIQKFCGDDFPLIVRLTVDEFLPVEKGKGIDLELGIRIAKELEALGVDALDISSGSYEQMNKWLETVSYECGWRKNLARAVKGAVNIPVIAANLIRSAEQAASQIEEGDQDAVGLGRPFLADPLFVKKLKEGREEDIRRCINCCQCFESLNKNAWFGKAPRCSVNPELSIHSKDALKSIKAQGYPKKIVIVGGGPAGLQAASLLASHGQKVVLMEKASRLGGQILLAGAPSDKAKLSWCTTDLIHDIEKMDVKLMMDHEADRESILKENPDALILATGAIPIRPRITGADQEHVFTFEDILSGQVLPKTVKTVAVIGSGMTGLETAEFLAAQGKKIIVVEMADQIAPGAYFQHRDEAIENLNKVNARLLSRRKLTEIRKGEILLDTGKGQEVIPADAVVLALGSRPYNPLAESLSHENFPVFQIGDANGIGRVADAVEQAYLTVKTILK